MLLGNLIYLVALEDKFHLTRLEFESDRFCILDIGFGDGEWMMNMSNAYPTAKITGIDLVASPRSCDLDIFPNIDAISPIDFTDETWPVRADSQDLVHLSLLCGTIPSFVKLYETAHK